MTRGKCALITGSSAGLGYAIAQALAQAGCNIVLNGIEPADQVEDKRRHLERAYGIQAAYRVADIGDEAGVTGLMQSAQDRFGGVDVLVNNAVVRHFSPVEEFPVARWNEALAVNLSAAFHTIRLALPGMRARSWGRIVNMSSIYGTRAIANRIDYVTTKTALIGMTRAVALETAGQDITCNAICPGTSRTPAIEARLDQSARDEDLSFEAASQRYLADRQPSGRFIGLDSVAALVVFLCGPAGRDITGAALPIDGAWQAS